MRMWLRAVGSRVIASPLALAILVVACGGDDTEVVPLGDSGPDRGGAAGLDGASGSGGAGMAGRGGSSTGGVGGTGGAGGSAGKGGTAGSGGAGGSAGRPMDGGGSDGGGSGGSTPDGGVDGGVDGADASGGAGGGDGSIDVADASQEPDGGGDGDGGPPLTIDEFQSAVAVAWCDRLNECCQYAPGRFDRDKCIANISTGFGPDRIFTYLRSYTSTGDAGRLPASLFFDANQAAACINMQRNRGCVSEDGPEKRALYATCVNAVQGTLFQGSPCGTSQECRSNMYCGPGEGGNVCLPIATLNQPCDDPNRSSDRCTYLGIHSATSLHCSSFATTGGTCVAGLDLGSSCKADQQCSSGVCSLLNSTCVVSQPNYPGPVTCNPFQKPDDAGPDGD